MWTFRFERQSVDRHDGLHYGRWSTEAEALQAAFLWQDDHANYSVEPVRVENEYLGDVKPGRNSNREITGSFGRASKLI